MNKEKVKAKKHEKKKKNKPKEKIARAEGQKENGGNKCHKAEICLYLQWGWWLPVSCPMGGSRQGKDEERSLLRCHFPKGGTQKHTQIHVTIETTLQPWGSVVQMVVMKRFKENYSWTSPLFPCSHWSEAPPEDKQLLVHLLFSQENKCCTSKVHTTAHPTLNSLKKSTKLQAHNALFISHPDNKSVRKERVCTQSLKAGAQSLLNN